MEVEALNENSLKVEWSIPLNNEETISMYDVNVTSLKSLSHKDTSFYGYDDNVNSMKHSIRVKVPANQNSTIIQNLLPFTMYEIQGKLFEYTEPLKTYESSLNNNHLSSINVTYYVQILLAESMSFHFIYNSV